MDENNDLPEWDQQMDNEAQRFEEEQAMLKADPAYELWLEFIDTQARREQWAS